MFAAASWPRLQTDDEAPIDHEHFEEAVVGGLGRALLIHHISSCGGSR